MIKLKHALPGYDEIAEGMRFWKIIQQDNNIKTKIYFDSAGAVDMLTGTNSVFKGNTFQKPLYERPSNLVYALASRKWLGDIYMLPPHTEEFIDSLTFNDRLFPPHRTDETSHQREELWYTLLKTRDLQGLGELIKGKQKMDKDIIHEIQRHPYHIFLGLYLTAGRNFWKFRYKDIVKEKAILRFSHETDYEFGDVTDSDLFRAVNNALNKKRARTANNYVDAIALCILDEKLQKAENQEEEPTILPLFFSNQDHILETVQELSREPDKSTGRTPFLYTDKHSGACFPVVRKASFFIIEGFVNAMRLNNNEAAIFELESTLNRIVREEKQLKQERNGVNAFRKMHSEYLEPDLHERVMLEFFDRWWQDNGAEEIMRELELHMEYENQEELDQQIHQQIEEDRIRLRTKIKGFGPRIKIIREAWHSLIGLNNFIREKFVEPQASSDAFNEFGPRYNFSALVCDKIQKWIDRAKEIVASGDEGELKALEADVISDLIDGLFEQEKDETAKKSRLDKLVASIGFFFFFERYDVVQNACDIVRHRHQEQTRNPGEQYPTPSIALIHAASVFHSRGQHTSIAEPEERALKIIECVDEKAKGNYKIWIGLSYLYNLLWEYRIKNYKFRELYEPHDFFDNILPSKGAEYLQHAIRYSKAAIDFLEKLFKEDDDPKKLKQRRQKYYYALNNYLFFKSLYTTPEEFATLDYLREKLDEITHDLEYFQEDRFSDTLARYYFRSAILTKDKRYFEIDLDDAIDFNQRAIRSRPKELYRNLERLLRRWKYKGYDEALARQKAFSRASFQ